MAMDDPLRKGIEQPAGSIRAESGVSAFNGTGFLTLYVDHADGQVQSLGQIGLEDAWMLASALGYATMEADMDAALISASRDLGLDDDASGYLLDRCREKRQETRARWLAHMGELAERVRERGS
jgi:hypothetical protein